MADLVGNALVAQSGGPTVVINASLAGVIQEAGRHPDVIEEIYGARHGVWGLLGEELVDLQEEQRSAVEGLKHSPAAALGTCYYELDFRGHPVEAARDLERVFEVFQAHRIRYFFNIGGNSSQDATLKIHEEAVRRGYEMRVLGIPKAVENDLPHTDHSPGYGSVIKHTAATVMELAMDTSSLAGESPCCCIIEVAGLNTGWIAAGAVLARRRADDGPHVILVPEVLFDEARFVARVEAALKACRCCVVVAAEGLRYLSREGKPEMIAEDKSWVDAGGNLMRPGVAERLAGLVQRHGLGAAVRTVKLGYGQRCAAHFASATDVAEAVACGEAAVRAAVAGQSGFMVKIVREQNSPYKSSMALQDLKDVAHVVRGVPREWLGEDGMMPDQNFIAYARPLIEGELKLTIDAGVPKYAALARVPVDKLLPPRS